MPIQFTTAFIENDCCFTWTRVAQSASVTEENKKLLTEIVKDEFKKCPKLTPSAVAGDCGSTEHGHVILMSAVYMLLIWIKDAAHCLDTVIKTAMLQVFGVV